MPAGTGRSLFGILRSNVFTLFNAVASGCFLVLLLLGAWQDALFGLFVIANSIIGIVQEVRAKRTLSRLAVLNAPRATVRRDGDEVECAPEDVVLDDLLVLRPGSQLVADAELVEAAGLEVDEALLTGEADPVRAPSGRMLLSGSLIVGGTGLARAIRVGADSYAAQLTSEARQFSLVRSELRSSIARIIRWISIALVPISALVVNGQMHAAGGWSLAIRSGAWREATVASVASIIAMVPQGLVLMTSVALAVGAVRLAGQRVLVQELAAVEGLARVDALCLDKTGTLTDGTLALHSVDAVGEPPAGWRQALAWFANDPDANATARAIRSAVGGVEAPSTEPVARVPFSNRHKWSAVRFEGHSCVGTWVLGGSDVVVDATAATDGRPHQAAAAAAAGKRTLLLAHTMRALDDDSFHPVLPDDLVAVAIITFTERVRPDASETLDYLAAEGVDIWVISGDDAATVAAIARAAGLRVDAEEIDARMLPADHAQLTEILRRHRVFGRVTPEQKKEMIRALQSAGHTVAMTGDGVNDTLALKQADLGIAMGSGSAAARAVARIVLLDGAFARLPAILAEGRRVIANVELLAKLFLTKTVYAILFAIAFGVLLWPFPFLPRQLSVIDGLTIGLPALVLALLPNAALARPGFLRRAAGFFLPAGITVAAAVVAVSASAQLLAVPSATELRTAAFVTLGLTGMWVLSLLARPFTAPTALTLGGASIGIVVVMVTPLAREFLELGPPTWGSVGPALAASLVAGIVLEITARLRDPSRAHRSVRALCRRTTTGTRPS